MTADSSRNASGRRRPARQPVPGKQPITRHRLFPAIVALWCACAGLLGSFVVPQWRIESLVTAIGLPSLVPAAAPPLGMTARLLTGLMIGTVMGLVGLVATRRLFGNTANAAARRRMNANKVEVADNVEAAAPKSGSLVGGLVSKLKRRKDANAVHDFDDLPHLRAADRHPDAPARRPFSATRDLGVDAGENEIQRRRRQLAIPDDASQPLPFVDAAPVPGSVTASAAPQRGFDPPVDPAQTADHDEVDPDTAYGNLAAWDEADDDAVEPAELIEAEAEEEAQAEAEAADAPAFEAEPLQPAVDFAAPATDWDDAPASSPVASSPMASSPVASSPVASSPVAAAAVTADALDGASTEALLHRLAVAISARVARLDREGDMPSPDGPGDRAVDHRDDTSNPVTGPFASPAPTQFLDIDPEQDGEEPGGFSSLLDIPSNGSLRERQEFVRIDDLADSRPDADGDDENDPYELVVVFPGQEESAVSPLASSPLRSKEPKRAFDEPVRSLEANAAQHQNDPEEMDRALKAALSTLKRMTGS